MASFEQYNKWRDKLVALIDKAAGNIESIAPDKAASYRKVAELLKEDSFRIQVVGTVKNGKSSFTNAIIGESILPVDDIPCTAVVSEVKYGPEKKAFVNFSSPLPTGLLDEIPVETKRYIESHNFGKDAKGKDVEIPPLEVPYDRMNQYVAIPEPGEDILFDPEALAAYRAKIDQESPFDVAKLFYPAGMLKDGVEIVDSPGLNESPKRTVVTLDYLNKADAAIYLLDASHSPTIDEIKVIENVLLPLGFKDLIMVANRMDLIGSGTSPEVQAQRRERQRRYIQSRIQEYSSINKCFGVSAKEFHDGVAARDNTLIQRSGIPEFIVFLTDYITKKKGAIKIGKPARQIVNSIKKDILDNLIPTRLAALEADTVTLQRRINEARPKLTAVEARRQDMILGFERTTPVALAAAKEVISAFFKKLETQIPQWIEEYTPKHDCGLYATKADLKIVAEEIVEHTRSKVKEAFDAWKESTFQPVLNEQSKLVFGKLNDDITRIAGDMAVIEKLLGGIDTNLVSQTSVIERMAGVAAMACLPLGRAGGDLFAGGFEITNFLKRFMGDIAISLGVGLLVLWIWPPLGFIASIAGAVVGLVQGTGRRVRGLKAKISESIVTNIKGQAAERVAKIQNQIREMFLDIQSTVIKGVDGEIETARQQLEELIRLTSAEQNSIAEKKADLLKMDSELKAIGKDIDALTEEVEKIVSA